MSIETIKIRINIEIVTTSEQNTPTTPIIKCLKCGVQIHKTPSKIKKHNFCSTTCYREYLRSPESTLSKGWKHTQTAKDKIRNANFKRNYDEVLTENSRRRMAVSAKNKVWTEEAREKLRQANIGKKLSDSQKQKIKANARYGEDNVMWKDFPSYVAMHMWVSRHKGKALICIECGVTSKDRKIEWSNIDHKYSRNLDEYIARCTPCHRKYDKSLLKTPLDTTPKRP